MEKNSERTSKVNTFYNSIGKLAKHRITQIIWTLAMLTMLATIYSCGENKAGTIASYLIKDLNLKDTIDEVEAKLNRVNIMVEDIDVDGYELLVFLQNNPSSPESNKLIINYISSSWFSPEITINSILPEIVVYKLNLPARVSGSKINNAWSPSELYFYKGKLFAISSFLPSESDKKCLTQYYSKNKRKMLEDQVKENGNKTEHIKKELVKKELVIELNEIYEDDQTQMNINFAGNLYIYDKLSYKKVCSYVEKKLTELQNQ